MPLADLLISTQAQVEVGEVVPRQATQLRARDVCEFAVEQRLEDELMEATQYYHDEESEDSCWELCSLGFKGDESFHE
jgi:hypothetical protein